MGKTDFKLMMSAYRKQLRDSLFKSKRQYIDCLESNQLAEKCLRPSCLPIVSRKVLLHIFSKSGLQAVAFLDNVEIKYR